MSRGQWSILLSLLGAFILVVAACAPAATPTPTATPTPPPVVATPTPGVATPTPTAATPTPEVGVAGMPVGYGYSEFGEWGMPLNLPPPQYGGIYRMGRSDSPIHYDQHRAYGTNVNEFMSSIFDNLIRVSPYLDISLIPATYEVQHLSPNLAERWETSADNRVATFYLKRGVKWHDGKPFTAKDVKYSMDKMLDPQRGSVLSADLAMVERTEIVDDYTVKVYLKYPGMRLFLRTLAQGQPVIQAEHLKGVSYRTTDFIVGTGGFKFKSMTAGVDFTMVKNPDYHFKGRPYYDGFVIYTFGTQMTGLQAMVAGQLDYWEQIYMSEDIQTLVDRVAPEILRPVSNRNPVSGGQFWSFIKEGPWQDVRVRKAWVMVLDNEALCTAQFGKLATVTCNPQIGYFIPAPAGNGLPWSVYEKAWGRDRPMAERIVAAKKLLAEAGYPNGFKIYQNFSSDPSPNALSHIDQMKRALNIEIIVKMVPRAQEQDLALRGDFELYSRGVVQFNGSMEQLVSSRFIRGGMNDYSHYYHPMVEDLYVKLLSEQDQAKALDIFHQIERLLIDDVPGFMLNWQNNGNIVWPYVTRHFMHPFWYSNYTGIRTTTWFDRNHPSWAKRAP